MIHGKRFNPVKWCLKHKKAYYKRVGYILILDYLISDEYLDTIFNLCNEYIYDKYYVKMSVEWLISMYYIKYPTKTLIHIK